MSTTVNERVVDLLKTLKMDEIELARKINKHPSTIYRIVNSETEPSKTTLKLIAEALNANYNYLITGNGEKLLLPNANEKQIFNYWKDEAYALMKDQLAKKDAMIERLMNKLMGDPNFRRALNKTALSRNLAA